MRPTEAPAPVRAVVWLILLTNVAWAVVLPLILVDAGSTASWLLVLTVLAVHTVAHLLVMRAAVSPWVEGPARWLPVAALVAATLVAWPVLDAHAEADEQPWAWLVGFTVGALPLVTRPLHAAYVSIGLAALVALGAMGTGDPVGLSIAFVAIAASGSGAFAAIVVWMMRLLVAAEAGRSAQARLVVAEERLRFSRELHDALGHRLNVIALKAELAGAEDIRDLASAAALDVRRAVHGYAALDLAEQLEGAELVLASAGVDVEVDVADSVLAGLASPIEQLIATAVREGVTNVLRHSDARSCRITFSLQAALLLEMVNDRPHGEPGTPGLGLTGLRERAAACGARVRTESADDRFALCVEVPR